MKKRVAAIALASSLVLGMLPSCVSADEAKDGITNIVMEYINFGFEDPDIPLVFEKINEITEEKIGVHVDYVLVPIADMIGKPGMMVQAGEQIDMIQTGLIATPQMYYQTGLLQPITEYVEKSETLKNLVGEAIEACKINGEIYAYPGSLYPGKGTGFIYDKALAEEYNIEVPEIIDGNEGLTEILKQVKESGMPAYGISLGDGVGAEGSTQKFDGLGSSMCTFGVVLDPENDTTVVDWFETDEYKEQSAIHQMWYDEGYSVPDSISNGYTVADSLTQGQCFGILGDLAAGQSVGYYANTCGKELGVGWVKQPEVTTHSVIGVSWGIVAGSPNAQACLDFIQLMYEDAELANLYNYGIEGKNYVLQEGSDRIIEYPEGTDAGTCGYGNFVPALGDAMKMYLPAPMTEEDFASIEACALENCKVSPLLGYTFDTSDVSTETASISAVVSQYGPSLNCGVLDAEATIPEFVDALKTAGIDKVVEENQKQLDQWLANK